jgi:pyrrolidone-carboxylate peptidase
MTRIYKKVKIFLTGYGPFGSITTNPSEILVNLIKKEKNNIEKELDFKCEFFIIEILEVNVSYVNKHNFENYEKIINDMSNQNKAESAEDTLYLIIHFGTESTDVMNFEKESVNYIDDQLSQWGEIDKSGDKSICCKLNLDNITEQLNKKGHKTKVSSDCGNYLCNYAFYLSSDFFQHMDNVITEFIHLPNDDVVNYDECKSCFIDFLKIICKNHLNINFF